jgi:hypothetical protein
VLVEGRIETTCNKNNFANIVVSPPALRTCAGVSQLLIIKTMNNSPEPIQNTQEDLSKTGIKAYSSAIRTSAIGCISALILALLAVLTLFVEGGDSAGPGFFIFGFLSVGVLVISGAIAIFTSLVGIANGMITFTKNKNLPEDITSAVTKNVGLILGIIVVMVILFKLLKNWVF